VGPAPHERLRPSTALRLRILFLSALPPALRDLSSSSSAKQTPRTAVLGTEPRRTSEDARNKPLNCDGEHTRVSLSSGPRSLAPHGSGTEVENTKESSRRTRFAPAEVGCFHLKVLLNLQDSTAPGAKIVSLPLRLQVSTNCSCRSWLKPARRSKSLEIGYRSGPATAAMAKERVVCRTRPP